MSGPRNAYMARYADPRAATYAARVQRRFNEALVVPMFDESPGVVNAHHAQSPEPVAGPDHRSGQRARRALRTPNSSEPGRCYSICRMPSADNVLVVDCVREGDRPPRQQGVGLARKLGTDIALQLFDQDRLADPWIFQTDADAALPNGYFDIARPAAGAVVTGHRHCSPDATLQFAARLYEWHMAYYHTSLARAGSRYAFPTLGSTIIVHADSYATVRGYPRKDAAEDFYLLNKIAKIAPVAFAPQVQVLLQARLSSRVPFGTGPALRSIVDDLQAEPRGTRYLSYHPQNFLLLAQALVGPATAGRGRAIAAERTGGTTAERAWPGPRPRNNRSPIQHC